MTLQYGTTLRTNQVGQIQTTVAAAGTTAMQLRLYSLAPPANCAATEQTANLLCTIVLPASFLTSSGGATTIAGVWSVASASGAGLPGSALGFRVYDMAGTPVCHVQGSVSATGGGGDLQLNNTSITATQTVTITSSTITAGNA